MHGNPQSQYPKGAALAGRDRASLFDKPLDQRLHSRVGERIVAAAREDVFPPPRQNLIRRLFHRLLLFSVFRFPLLRLTIHAGLGDSFGRKVLLLFGVGTGARSFREHHGQGLFGTIDDGRS